MSHFVRTTGGLLQLQPDAVNSRDIAKLRAFAARLGYPVAGLRQGRSLPPAPKRSPAPCVLQDLQATEPEAFYLKLSGFG